MDIRDRRPEAMEAYLANYGWHFNRKLCTFAVSQMKRLNAASGKKERIEPITREKLAELLAHYGVVFENDVLYDSVYAANMCKADFLKSSVPDEQHLALYVKDVIDDADATDGLLMRRWYAGMVAAGEPVEWDEML